MQYKLIEHPKQNGEWLAVSQVEIKNGEYYTSHLGNIDVMGAKNFWSFPLYKIIASSIFIDKYIPLMRREQLKFNSIKKGSASWVIDKWAQNGFKGLSVEEIRDLVDNVSSYNKHAETHLWTDEDLRKVIDKAFSYGYMLRGSFTDEQKKEYDKDQCIIDCLQSLKQPKGYIVEFQPDYEGGIVYNDKDHLYPFKIDKEGYVNITSIKLI